MNISAVPKTFPKDYMWRRFSGAAIFNQTYVIYANRPGPFFSGYSAVFDPRGNTICEGGRRETILEAEIDLREVDKWREEEVIYPYRRPLLYREVVNRHRAETVVAESQIRECQLAVVKKGETKRVA
ncbi:MAG: nitrilase-related carbon-nitrogen hydrolase [Thermodesulfobacteriota bacterium]|nr:nitrilase-related carbon-nitrogen hydrolase [Thermodesulfobacteriota bacterium]